MTRAPGDLKVLRSPGGVAVWIHLAPRSRRPGVGETHGGALRVAVAEPPLGGRANAACARALARSLRVRPDAVELDPGARGRRKRVRIRGDPGALEARLRALAGIAAPAP